MDKNDNTIKCAKTSSAGSSSSSASFQVIALPAFADVHVHLREPGYEAKENIATGTAAAAAGGFADVFTMPNLSPVPDSLANIQRELDAIDLGATVRVHPFGAITKGEAGRELADLEALAPFVAGFSDDGKGVQDSALMREAMIRAKALGKPIVAHCEMEGELRPGGCVHDGAFAAAHGLIGISSASEWKAVERDLELVRETGAQYHICHVSTKESVALVRAAKSDGLPVTCETAPHYLLLTESDLKDEGRFKMNPPVRGEADREALLSGLADGTVDCIATDHAPHTAKEKSRGLSSSLFGIVGLETAFPLCYTYLVEAGILSLDALVDRMAIRPRRIFGLPVPEGNPVAAPDAVFAAVGIDDVIDPKRFFSKGRATPFAGWRVSARIVETRVGGTIAYSDPMTAFANPLEAGCLPGTNR